MSILNNKLRYRVEKKKFTKITNQKIVSIKRRSKYLLLELTKNITILIHLGMTGKFFIIDRENIKYKTSFYYNLKKIDKHDHIIFYLNKKTKLIYNDIRKFGFVKILKTDKINLNSHLKFLGPEPLSKNFNKNYFKNYIKNKKKKIKDLLMDQKFVSGLGNIYCNEILFLSKISPFRLLNKISQNECAKIVVNTKKILIKSIKNGGSSIKDFDNDGVAGSFQELFNVYGRENNNCSSKRCSNIITKAYISGRSSFFCLSCQK